MQPWLEFLNPEATRPRLLAASTYVAAFEAMKALIVARPRGFFRRFGAGELRIDPRYQTDVLARNRSPVYASLDWLKDIHAIDDADIEIFDRVKECRNTLAHDLLHLLTSTGLPTDFEQRFGEMLTLLRKIEVWWVVNVEIPADPQFDGVVDIDEASIMPGSLVSMRVLLDVALGDAEHARQSYREARNPADSDA